jgi:glutathione S-transferase
MASTMRVYHAPKARSTRVLWTLEEIGIPYEVTTLTRDERRGEEHRRLHPLGRVPVLELDDGQVLFESAAICLQLADLYPEAGLMPPVGSDERGIAYQWTVFAVSELEKVAFGWTRVRRSGGDETEAAAAFAPVAAALRRSLESHPWIAGETFTVADILTASILRNAVRLDLLDEQDRPRAYVERALARPANLRADALDAA